MVAAVHKICKYGEITKRHREFPNALINKRLDRDVGPSLFCLLQLRGYCCHKKYLYRPENYFCLTITYLYGMLCIVILAVWFSYYTIAAYIYDLWLVRTNHCFPEKYKNRSEVFFW